MRALLDTQALLWFAFDDPRLGAGARRVVEEETNEVLVSVASSWEIVIKYGQGRLPQLPQPPEIFVPDCLSGYGFSALPIHLLHTLRLGGLPSIHRDPFDRILVAQSYVEGVPILTSDPLIARYGVQVIW